MKLQFFLLLFVIGAIWVAPLSAQQRKFDVGLKVSSKDKNVQASVESYLSRELRTLGDVNVTNEKPMYTLEVMHITATTGRGLTGHVLSVVVVFHVPCTVFGTARTCDLYDDHVLYIDSSERLRQMCEEIITDFDTRSIKILRKK